MSYSIKDLKTYIIEPTYITLYNAQNIINKNCINEIIQYVGIDNVIDFFIYDNVDNIETKHINEIIYNRYGIEIINYNNECFNRDNIKSGILNYFTINDYNPYLTNDINICQSIANNIIIYINSMIFHWIKNLNNTIFKLLYHKDNENVKRRANIPSWIYLEFIKMIELDNIKLFHLTDTKDKANDIFNNGFIYGVNDITKIGLSNYYEIYYNDNENKSNQIKKSNGLNYAYMYDHPITDLHINTFGKYKINFELLNNNSNVILLYHRVDKEQQVIFDYNKIKLIPISIEIKFNILNE